MVWVLHSKVPNNLSVRMTRKLVKVTQSGGDLLAVQLRIMARWVRRSY